MTEVCDSQKGAARKALIRTVMTEYGLTEDELFGQTRSITLSEARRKVAVGLRSLGLSATRIGEIMRRDHSTVLYYFAKTRRQHSNLYMNRVVLRLLPRDQRNAIVAMAKTEDVSIETLIAQWVGERAAYELAEKARAA